MKKRFTDIELPDKEWWQVLPMRLKLAWDILCRRCNFIGIWHINMRKLNFEIGEDRGTDVTLKELQEHFKVQVFDADKLFLPSFVPFQYGDEKGRLSPGNKFHLSIAEKLEILGLPTPTFKPIDEESTPTDNTTDTHPDGCSHGQGKGQGKGRGKGPKKKGVKGEKNYPPEFEAFWKIYPRRVEKSEAFKAFQANVDLAFPETMPTLMLATTNFAKAMAAEKREVKHIRHATTFLNDGKWTDWITPEESIEPLPDSLNAPAKTNWLDEARIVFQAAMKHGFSLNENLVRAIGPRAELIRQGGIKLYVIGQMKNDEYTIKHLAGQLKAAAEIKNLEGNQQ
jgi:hypothetical protein